MKKSVRCRLAQDIVRKRIKATLSQGYLIFELGWFVYTLELYKIIGWFIGF